MNKSKVFLRVPRGILVRLARILLKSLLGILIKLLYPVRVKNRWRVPRRGPVVFALGPHTTAIESAVFTAAFLNLVIGFLAKSQYWDKWWSAFFMDAVGAFPLKRGDGREADVVINTSAQYVANGGIVAIYPEGTRNRTGDSKVHKGGNGIIRVALRAGTIAGRDVVIVPAGLRDFDDLKLPWEKCYRWRIRTVVIGEPIYLSNHKTVLGGHLKGRALEFSMAQRVMPPLMKEIARLSGREYIDEPLPISH